MPYRLISPHMPTEACPFLGKSVWFPATKVAETTFRPLSRGRVRCNQTGEIVQRARTDSYRNQRHAHLHPRQPDPVKVRRKIRTTIAAINPFAFSVCCPECSEYNILASKELAQARRTCDGCGIIIILQSGRSKL